MPHDLALDCGSGGTRVYQWSEEHGLVRLKWPGGERAPVLSKALPSEAGRRQFINGVEQLADGGKSIFIGATAGLRYALEKGELTVADIDAFTKILPAGCTFRIISPLEEAQYEHRALVAKCNDTSIVMMSMGGKSMQLGRGDTLFSLPFAMHVGFGELLESHLPWQEAIASVAAMYESRCLEEKTKQNLLALDGIVVGVTDTMDVAAALDLLGKKVTKIAFLEALECCINKYTALEKASLQREDFVLLARSLLLRAVVRELFASTCEVLFKEEWGVNWTAGYFLIEAQL